MYCAIKYCVMEHRIMTLQKKTNAKRLKGCSGKGRT